jgi:hypothetical protein
MESCIWLLVPGALTTPEVEAKACTICKEPYFGMILNAGGPFRLGPTQRRDVQGREVGVSEIREAREYAVRMAARSRVRRS